ncbi:putative methyltransferase NSUN6 isoform X2 [Selaginella moellendorffii]|uniref:putative methyltransferase NSUN6 isoform X2 n=1 Tax=Selaginella moellendorffii TaxID=88036 RepID=UPI000D1CFA57|nr:putative methyltransferase NSUN6 isoform X2 [Selaginella moellendorffii]|eukprot:XP_024521153.1 putative methyltransferase NSUN6 isoform X2 [Selaginella moellendorffii]
MQRKLGYRPALLWNPAVYEYLREAYGPDHFSRICDALTRPSTYCCVRVNAMQTSTAAVIAELKEFLSSKEAEGTTCYEHPLLKNVVIVPGRGPCDVSYDDEVQKIVMVSRKCAEAVLRGAEVFVPGVLACSEHVDEGDSVAVFARIEVKDSAGKWSNGVTRGTTIPLSDWESSLGGSPYDWFIGKGRAMMSRPTLFRERQGIAVKMTDRIYNLPAFHGILEGRVFLQNLPSIVTAIVLDPQPGERILDMCAAPGGKTTAIASLMNNTGEVIALDRTHNKVLEILSLAKELGLSCIQAFKLDALKSVQVDSDAQSSLALTQPLEKGLTCNYACVFFANISHFGRAEIQCFMATLGDPPQTEVPPTSQYTSKARERKESRRLKNGRGRGQHLGGRVDMIKRFPPNSFDRVLLDAPCSALGLRPRLFAAEETLESLGRHAIYQRRLFDRAVELVKAGGTLVYSTCTINPGENEALVRYALDKYKFLVLVDQVPKIGGPGLVGGTSVYDGRGYREWLKEGEQYLVQRFDPSSPVDTIGFFIAKFQVPATKSANVSGNC